MLLTAKVPAGLLAGVIAELRALSRFGIRVANLYDTAIAGAGIVPAREVSRWWGDHSNDRGEAIELCQAASKAGRAERQSQ